ncbi:AER349Cp [Eremothecium gossypii ATCC 10895]|uniref:AER349Cp n=1 Tax=Eremothecium gossypii (strain ATCC 10895 / CBS 109.51 / FGSC 9923 / NRRL Y-1056) TaxID=284811 RepID=Q756B8_EREGS|nr:AER349Cp [Eremothecium gossypii ATCC 10895]AAS53029.1 AER349Cp [Eremothecium gossypii ATCC 10895]AEY97337.1 FAER349Cp [Eremothecium gossypii FDAG1]
MGTSNTVHVSGFPAETRARDMAPDFEAVGKIVRIDIPPMRPFQDRPFAFVKFETHEECVRAVEELDGRPFTPDTRFTYHVQVARSRPYAPYAPRNGRGAPGGYREAAYRGRDVRDQDPRDYRVGLLARGRDDDFRFREPREYRDREPPRAYETAPPPPRDEDYAPSPALERAASPPAAAPPRSPVSPPPPAPSPPRSPAPPSPHSPPAPPPAAEPAHE